MLVHLENEDLSRETKDGIVLVDFFATWCGPCKMLAPELDMLSNERSDIKIVKVDIDKHESLARQYGIMSVPTLLFMKNGQILKQTSGYLPKDIIKKTIDSL